MSDPILVLGIGNILWSDEGFGVRAVERLHAGWEFPAHVRLMDGGTRGLFLIQYVQEASRLLVFDAVDFGHPPGTIVVLENEDVPRFMGARKMSLHQTGFQDVLAAASLTGRSPGDLLLIGIQPLELEVFGGSLTDPVRSRMDECLALARERLCSWGAAPVARDVPLSEEDGLSPLPVAWEAYEDS